MIIILYLTANVNLALGQPTFLSTTYSFEQSTYSSSRAVDGDRQSTCSMTIGSDAAPYLYVDLSDMYEITHVIVVSRPDNGHHFGMIILIL